MLLNKKYFILTVYIFLFLVNNYGNLIEARIEYENSNITESLNLYNNWLQNNNESKDFSSVLFEVAGLTGDIYSITKILEDQIKFVTNKKEKKELHLYLAQLYELSSNIEKTQLHYQNAALSLVNEVDYKLLLKSVKYLILKGELFLAESQLDEIITNSSNNIILTEAQLLYTFLTILHSKNSTTGEIYTIDSPESLYIVYLIEKANSNITKMDSAKEKLIKNFESSPEAELLRNKIKELPDVLISLGLLDMSDESNVTSIFVEDIKPDNTKNFMIQAGSFTDQENAYYHSTDLIAAGFESIVEEQIINNIKYHKVLLYFSNEVQMRNTLKKLKEKGFAGFPVY